MRYAWRIVGILALVAIAGCVDKPAGTGQFGKGGGGNGGVPGTSAVLPAFPTSEPTAQPVIGTIPDVPIPGTSVKVEVADQQVIVTLSETATLDFRTYAARDAHQMRGLRILWC